jgi:hypothetical protein
VTVAQAGKYQLNIIYMSEADTTILVRLNNAQSAPVILDNTGAWDIRKSRQLLIGNFNAGVNYIWISGAIGHQWNNYDCIELKNTPEL